tara:strand:+ start:78 stop:551 length:474 start_codon:yes stop_codon:yes gene_type:complete
MKKIAIVLVIALALVGCQKDELPTQDVSVTLIESMNDTTFERVGDSISGGLRVNRDLISPKPSKDIYKVYESNSQYCFLESRLATNEFRLVTSDEDTYSYRVRVGSGAIYQYAFRSDDNGESLRLTEYSYDEVSEEHTFLSEFNYVKTVVEFNICNN